MARTAKPTASAKTPANGRRQAASPGSTPTKPAAVPTRARKPVAVKTAAAASPAPRSNTDALREQVEALERTVVRLQARIDELESRLAAMEDRASRPAVTPSRTAARGSRRDAAPVDTVPADAAPPRSRRGGRLSPERDPGDAVPPGVAVREPEPMDGEAAAALENLEDRLRPAEG